MAINQHNHLKAAILNAARDRIYIKNAILFSESYAETASPLDVLHRKRNNNLVVVELLGDIKKAIDRLCYV